MIRQVQDSDSEKISEIYNYYTRESIATFEEEVSSTDMRSRIRETASANLPWIVAESGTVLLAMLMPASGRAVVPTDFQLK
ncbi:MAG: L-amino acid N-acyltransferase YncA [Planctomycetota bacterium]|jgi:L-amino acid N-acyltransferase YncA